MQGAAETQKANQPHPFIIQTIIAA
jgi:hypothetical protein